MKCKLVLCLSAVILLSTLMAGCGSRGDSSVPVKVQNADRVQTLAFNLMFDSSVLEVKGVYVTSLTLHSTAQWVMEATGRLLVLLSEGDVSGNGNLVTVVFKILKSQGSSALTVEVKQATSKGTGSLETQTSAGSFTGSNSSFKAPVITFIE
jgi:hypothetical protein